MQQASRRMRLPALAAVVVVVTAAVFGIHRWRVLRARAESRGLAERAWQLLNRHPLQAESLTTAAELAKRAQALDPDGARPYFVLGVIALERQQSADAVEYLRASVARDPDGLAAPPFLADVLLSLGEAAEAQGHLERYLARAPRDLEARYLLAESFRQQGAPGRAMDQLQAILDIQAEHRQARLALAQLEIEAGEFDSAAAHARTLLKRDPGDRQAEAVLEQSQRRQRFGAPAAGNSNPRQAVPIQFTEVAEVVGVHFHHTNGASAARYLPELLGSGVAVFDYDGDGWLDLYFASGAALPIGTGKRPPGNVLYRNRGDGHFEDRTGPSGLAHGGFDTGLAVADYDNDGDDDVYITGYGPNTLFRNMGDGTFEDVTRIAGVADAGMGTGAAWLDADGDGDLDLYVVNYAQYDVADPLDCTDPAVGNIYCGVQRLSAAPDTFYVNQGDGTFEEGTHQAGIARGDGKGMGVVAADLNGDGYTDLFVANDTTPNFVFLGKGQGTFEDVTRTSGAGSDRDDQLQGSMGVAIGDLNGDALPEVFVTNYWMEHNTLYRNLGGLFTDVTDRAGVGMRSLRAVGWGTVMADFNSDGALDVFVANGHFYDWRGPSEPLRQLPELWMGEGVGQGQFAAATSTGEQVLAPASASLAVPRFVDVGSAAGEYFGHAAIGRGTAGGDLDNDGDLELVISHWGGPAAVLRNDTQRTNRWIALELIGLSGNRSAIGAAVAVETSGRRWYRQVSGGGSYLSSSDRRIVIGLGDARRVKRLFIRWPGGSVQQWEDLDAGQAYRIIEGEAKASHVQWD